MNDEDIRWKKIPCVCSQNPALVQEIYPIKNCLHCKFQECEDSIPRVPFNTKYNKKDGSEVEKTITEITLVRGEIYHDIIAYKYHIKA